MTVLPPGGDCEPPPGIKFAPEPRDESPKRCLLTLWQAFIIAAAVLIGIGAGVLAFFAFHRPAEAVLAGAAATAGAVKFLQTVVS